MKTVCVLLLGWFLFDSVLTAKNMLGMFMAVIGMITYSWAVELAKTQAAKAAAARVLDLNVAEEEDSLLKSDLEFGRIDKP
jgi:solute carrier family 35 protein E3